MLARTEGRQDYAPPPSVSSATPLYGAQNSRRLPVDNLPSNGIDSPPLALTWRRTILSLDRLGDETVQGSLWRRCLAQLEVELPEQQFNTWIRPLQAVEDGRTLRLLAPNRFVVDWVNENVVGRISELVDAVGSGPVPSVVLEVGSRAPAPAMTINSHQPVPSPRSPSSAAPMREIPAVLGSRLNPDFTFANFVEGKSNQL